MFRLEIARAAFTDCFRSPRLRLIQFFANLLLFALLVAWLFIPVASDLHLILNFFVALLLLIATLTLHAGTLNSFIDQQSTQAPPLWPAFRRALNHIIPVAICIMVFCLLWLSIDRLETYQSSFPAYVRSTFPVSLRRHTTLPALDNLFSVVIFILRWILAPGLVLPLLAQAADRGFRGFGKQGLIASRKTLFSLNYWLVLTLAALLGVSATEKLMGARPNFKSSTTNSEAISLAWRLTVSYLLGLFSWMFACSVVGRCAATAGTSQDISGNPVA
jgi:hypothetical protein